MRVDSHWDELGIAPTADLSAIRKAYARRLKQIDVDRDAASFMALREARELALEYAAANEDVGSPADAPEAAGPVEALPEDRCAAFSPPVISEGHEFARGELLSTTVQDVALQYKATGDGIRLSDRSAMDSGGIDVSVWSAPRLYVALPSGHVSRETVGIETDFDRIYQDIWALMFPEAGAAEDVEGDPLAARFLDLFTTALTDPRLTEIGFYGDTERWFSEVLARSSPLSDPVIEPVASHFAWLDRADEVGQLPAILYLVDRLKLLSFADAVRQPHHPHYRAWRELVTPAAEGARRGWGVSRKRVNELLSEVRTNHPALEEQFDWYRVNLWEKRNHVAASTGRWVLLAFVGFQLLRLLAQAFPERPPAQPSSVYEDQLTTPDADIDEALSKISGNNVASAELKQRNPELYDFLLKIWEEKWTAGKNKWDMAADVGQSIDDRYAAVWRKANYRNMTDLELVRLEKARFFRNKGANYCDNYFHGRPDSSVALPSELLKREQEIRLRIVFDTRVEVEPSPPKASSTTTFVVPGPVLENAAKRSGLVERTLVKALQDGGTAEERCNARIALHEAALALPQREALNLIRKF